MWCSNSCNQSQCIKLTWLDETTEVSSDLSTPLSLSRKQKQEEKEGEETKNKKNKNMQLGLDNKQASVRAVEIMSLVGNRVTLQQQQKRLTKQTKNRKHNTCQVLAFLLRIRDTDLESSPATVCTSYLCPVSLSVHLFQYLSIYIYFKRISGKAIIQLWYCGSLMIWRSRVWFSAGMEGVFSSPKSTFCADSGYLLHPCVTAASLVILPEVTAEHACTEWWLCCPDLSWDQGN